MENLQSGISMTSKNCYFSSVDSCPVHVCFQKYLKFQFDGICYKCTIFPNRLACCTPRFTKLLKPVLLPCVRNASSIVFIGDTLLFGQCYGQC